MSQDIQTQSQTQEEGVELIPTTEKDEQYIGIRNFIFTFVEKHMSDTDKLRLKRRLNTALA